MNSSFLQDGICERNMFRQALPRRPVEARLGDWLNFPLLKRRKEQRWESLHKRRPVGKTCIIFSFETTLMTLPRHPA